MTVAWDGTPLSAEERKRRYAERARALRAGIENLVCSYDEFPERCYELAQRLGFHGSVGDLPCWCGAKHEDGDLEQIYAQNREWLAQTGWLCPMCGEEGIRFETRPGKGTRRGALCVACENRIRKRGEHGSEGRYRAGCRCDICVAEQADRETR
jgi:hypothetical protein